MNVNNNYSNVNFQAKFLKSDSLYDVVHYAIDNGKFEKLNQARKNIDNACLRTRLQMDIAYTNNSPTVIFTKYEPKKLSSGLFTDDFIPTNRVEYICTKPKTNPLEFALRMIIKMGNSAPKNNIYKNVVIAKNPKSVKDLGI